MLKSRATTINKWTIYFYAYVVQNTNECCKYSRLYGKLISISTCLSAKLLISHTCLILCKLTHIWKLYLLTNAMPFDNNRNKTYGPSFCKHQSKTIPIKTYSRKKLFWEGKHYVCLNNIHVMVSQMIYDTKRYIKYTYVCHIPLSTTYHWGCCRTVVIK